MPEIEFSRWETPFKDGRLTILDVVYQNSDIFNDLPEDELSEGMECPTAKRFDLGNANLVVRLWELETNAIYSLTFEDIGAYRVLDEHGLTEIWGHQRPANSTFKVRNHLWSKESELSFVFYAKDDWSYMIATGWQCVEIVCKESPAILHEIADPQPAK